MKDFGVSDRFHQVEQRLVKKGIVMTKKQREVLEKLCDALDELGAGEGKTILISALYTSDK